MSQTIGRRKINVAIVSFLGVAIATPISNTNVFATEISFHFPAGNTGANGYIGSADVDATWIPRPKGSSFNLVHGTGTLSGSDPVLGFNLAKLFVLADTSDTCIVEYMAFDSL